MLSLSAILFSIPSREPFTKISFLAFIFQDLLLRQLDFRFPFLLHEKYPRFYGASYISFCRSATIINASSTQQTFSISATVPFLDRLNAKGIPASTTDNYKIKFFHN
jgi:hypothetical protein